MGYQVLEAGVFAGEILVPGVVGEHLGIAQLHFDLGEPAREFLDKRTQIHAAKKHPPAA
jgi:hypothetical protein